MNKKNMNQGLSIMFPTSNLKVNRNKKQTERLGPVHFSVTSVLNSTADISAWFDSTPIPTNGYFKIKPNRSPTNLNNRKDLYLQVACVNQILNEAMVFFFFLVEIYGFIEKDAVLIVLMDHFNLPEVEEWGFLSHSPSTILLSKAAMESLRC